MLSRRQPLVTIVALATVLLGILSTATLAEAATIVVTSTADPGAGTCTSTCTLHDALAAATNGDTILFGVTGTIGLTGALTVSKNVTIIGPGAPNLTLDGQGAVRVLVILPNVTAAITGVTIKNGLGPGAPATTRGGGILNQGTLAVTNSLLTDNLAQLGGGIYNDGTLTVTSTTLSANHADAGPGAGRGGGISNAFARTLTVTRSTFSGNEAGGNGAGIDNSGALTVTNSTLSGNTAPVGGGIFSLGSMTLTYSTVSDNAAVAGGALYVGGTASVRNSILAHNTAPANCEIVFATLTSLGNNLSDDTSCIAGGTQGDIVAVTPLLGPLALNAPGATMTQALLAGSPAIDGVTFNRRIAPDGAPTSAASGGPRRPGWRAATSAPMSWAATSRRPSAASPLGPPARTPRLRRSRSSSATPRRRPAT
jgi:hypothetical protein